MYKDYAMCVYNSMLHPCYNSTLCTLYTHIDGTSKLWDIEYGTVINSTGHNYDQFYHDFIWNTNGSEYIISNRSDQSIHTIDARSNITTSILTNIYESMKNIRILSLHDDADRILTIGINNN